MYEIPQQLKRAIEQNNSLQFSAILDRLLTDKSFDLDRSNECGRTLLGYAAEDNRVDIIKILLDRGADINSIDYPLHLAVEFDRPQTIDLLLDRGANIDRLDSNRSTPIALATSGMNANICLKLIERSADVNIADCLGLKPIHYALAWSLTDVIEAIGGSEFDRLDVFLCLETPPLTIDRSVDSELSELKRYVSNYSNLLAILINFFLLSPFQQSAIMPRLPAVTKFDFRDGDVETDSSLDVLCCGYEQILSNLIFSIEDVLKYSQLRFRAICYAAINIRSFIYITCENSQGDNYFEDNDLFSDLFSAIRYLSRVLQSYLEIDRSISTSDLQQSIDYYLHR